MAMTWYSPRTQVLRVVDIGPTAGRLIAFGRDNFGSTNADTVNQYDRLQKYIWMQRRPSISYSDKFMESENHSTLTPIGKQNQQEISCSLSGVSFSTRLTGLRK